MSEKPDKLIPRLFRFTEDDIRMIGQIRETVGWQSDAETVREAIRVAHYETFKDDE
jgi:hypothetical protein